MVWSNWQGAIWRGAMLVLLFWTGLAWTQTPGPRPVADPADKIMVVTEENGRKTRCRVMETWQLPDGRMAQLLQALGTGEMITVLDEPGSTPDMKNARAMPKRIFTWGRDDRRAGRLADPAAHADRFGSRLRNEVPPPVGAILDPGPMIVNRDAPTTMVVQDGSAPRIVRASSTASLAGRAIRRWSSSTIRRYRSPSRRRRCRKSRRPRCRWFRSRRRSLTSGSVAGDSAGRFAADGSEADRERERRSDALALAAAARGDRVRADDDWCERAPARERGVGVVHDSGDLSEKALVSRLEHSSVAAKSIDSERLENGACENGIVKADDAKKLQITDDPLAQKKADDAKKLKQAEDLLAQQNKVADKQLANRIENITKMPYSTAMSSNPIPEVKKPERRRWRLRIRWLRPIQS